MPEAVIVSALRTPIGVHELHRRGGGGMGSATVIEVPSP